MDEVDELEALISQANRLIREIDSQASDFDRFQQQRHRRQRSGSNSNSISPTLQAQLDNIQSVLTQTNELLPGQESSVNDSQTNQEGEMPASSTRSRGSNSQSEASFAVSAVDTETRQTTNRVVNPRTDSPFPSADITFPVRRTRRRRADVSAEEPEVPEQRRRVDASESLDVIEIISGPEAVAIPVAPVAHLDVSTQGDSIIIDLCNLTTPQANRSRAPRRRNAVVPEPVEVIDLSTPVRQQTTAAAAAAAACNDQNSGGDLEVVASSGTPQGPHIQCSICLDSAVPRNPVAVKCGHIFCLPCITEWMRLNPKCPICKRKATVRNLTRLYVT